MAIWVLGWMATTEARNIYPRATTVQVDVGRLLALRPPEPGRVIATVMAGVYLFDMVLMCAWLLVVARVSGRGHHRAWLGLSLAGGLVLAWPAVLGAVSLVEMFGNVVSSGRFQLSWEDLTEGAIQLAAYPLATMALICAVGFRSANVGVRAGSGRQPANVS